MRDIVRMFGNACLAWEFYCVFLFNDLFNVFYTEYTCTLSEYKNICIGFRIKLQCEAFRKFLARIVSNTPFSLIEINFASDRETMYL
jgi:hypothetical protein